MSMPDDSDDIGRYKRRKKQHGYDSGKPKPVEHTAKLGHIEAHISEAGNSWSEGAIRVNFTSDSEWLLRPEQTEMEKEPSAADKMLAIIRSGLTEKGMHILEDNETGGKDGPGIGGRFQKQLQLMAFHSFMPGDDGVVIRAVRGEYDSTEFNAAVIAREANDIIDRMAYQMREVRGHEDTAEFIDRIYRKMEIHRGKVSDLLPEIPHDKAQEIEELTRAIADKMPAKFFPNNAELVAAAGVIAKGAFGADGQRPWRHTSEDGKRGRDDDPLHTAAVEVIKGKVSPGTTPVVVSFIAAEACDAVYAQLTGHHPGYPGH